MFRSAASAMLLGCLGIACGSDPITEPDDPPDAPPRPPAEVAQAIGRGDGSSGSVRLDLVLETVIRRADSLNPDAVMIPTALAWNPSGRNELWVTLVEEGIEGPCTADDGTGCRALEGAMAIVHRATAAVTDPEVVQDGNGWHFLRHPMGVAFGPSGGRQLLCTCGEARTANFTNEEVPYNGPVLWDADRSLFGAEPSPGMNGTHIDMLHETPYCMGVAHERANAYWVFNGDVGALDRYDFNEPHEPGGEDHSDGELWRYAEGELLRVPGVPSHMAYDPRQKLLYVADSGHGRVVALDTTSGFEDGEITAYETIPTHLRVSGAALSEVLPSSGAFDTPSGLTFTEGVLFVTDHATSRIVAMDPSGNVLRELDTGLPPDSLGGISIGPDGKAYITDLQTAEVFRIEPL